MTLHDTIFDTSIEYGQAAAATAKRSGLNLYHGDVDCGSSSDVLMNKQELSERDICTKYITPPLQQAGWDCLTQLREEVAFTKGRIIVRGEAVTRGRGKRAGRN